MAKYRARGGGGGMLIIGIILSVVGFVMFITGFVLFSKHKDDPNTYKQANADRIIGGIGAGISIIGGIMMAVFGYSG